MSIKTLSTLYLLLLLHSACLYSQQSKIIVIKNDTASINLLNNSFPDILKENTDSAKYIAKQALSIAQKIDYQKGIASALNNLGLANSDEENYKKALELYLESATIFEEIKAIDKLSIVLANIGNLFSYQNNYLKTLEYYQLSLKYAKEVKDDKRTASLLGNIGIIYYNMSVYPKAIYYYMQSLKIRQAINDEKGIAFVYNNIGLVYDEQKNYRKSIEQYSKSLEIRRKIDDKKGVTSCLINIGVAYSNLQNNKKALEYYNQSLKIATEIDFKTSIAAALNNIGDIYFANNQYNQSLNYYLKNKAIYDSLKDNKGLTISLINIGKINQKIEKLNEAINYFQQALSISKNANFRDQTRNIYRYLSEIYFLQKKTNEAYQYLNLYANLNDSILSQTSVEQVAEMQIKYEVAQKENEIQLLLKNRQLQTLAVKEKQLMIYSLIGLLILLIGLFWLGFKSYRQKNINKQLLLKQENDLAMREAEKKMFNKVIETEEKERKRFAKDLHDGLGPLLSGIKLYINELEIDKDSKDAEQLVKYTSELIDDAINTTRMLANNLTPTIIEDYGLVEAIKLFSDKVSFTGALEITVIDENTLKITNKITEIIIYRVILELINNTLKHANASAINIHFSNNNKKYLINYSDNGKGFDLEATLQLMSKGLGINNIIHRVNSINGVCNISSTINNGMTANITIPIEEYVA